MSEIFRKSEQLIDKFGLHKRSEYVEATPFTKKIGFSVQRQYPEKSKFKPPTKKDGSPDTYAIIGISYEPNRMASAKQNLVPISAKVSAFSRFSSKDWDYDFDNEDCPTEDSVIASKKTPKPVDLSVFNQYMYDHDRDVFLNADGKTIEGISIIDDLYERHLATVDKFKGLVFRWKLASQNRFAAFCEALREVLKWLLKKICGRALEPDEAMRGIWGDYRPEDMKLLNTESFVIFGYKTSINVMVTFCILILVGSLIVYWTSLSLPWFNGIAKNSLLVVVFSILIISFLDRMLPKLFFLAINGLNRLKRKILSRSVKFK